MGPVVKLQYNVLIFKKYMYQTFRLISGVYIDRLSAHNFYLFFADVVRDNVY